MTKNKSLINNLNPIDLIVVVFYLLLSVINVIFHYRIEGWFTFVLLNFLLIFFVFALAWLDEKNGKVIISQLRYWYLVPLIFITFKELYFLVQPIRQTDYDHILIAIDRFLFGVNPTEALYSISFPLLTELLQIVYGTFFFLPVILAIDLLLNGRLKELEYEAFIIVLGFFLSYLGYLFVPAIGPRFTLHDFTLINEELPGLFLTNYLRDIVNAGESITSGAANAAEIVQRDVFPSGHTQMTVLVMYLSYKLRTKTRYFFYINGSLLVFSTVYLRYHYVVDVIGGLIFVVLTLLLGKPLFNWWQRKRNKDIFEYPRY